MKKTIGILALGLMLVLTSCKWGDYYYVDFDSVPTDKSMFKVTSQKYTDLSTVPADCYLPDGMPLSDWHDESAMNGPRKASGTTAAGFFQALLDKVNGTKVMEIAGTYTSTDTQYGEITLSGKVLMPADGKFDRYILVSHYTIGSDREAPSNAFPLEGLLCSMGYALICPDYIGYGVTRDKIHPYLVMDITAMNVVDMYLSVKSFFDAAGIHPKYDDIYLLGYSQGGATTMAVEYIIETLYNWVLDDPIKIRRVFAGGGPYDVQATYNRFVTTDVADYPIAVPLVLQGMIEGNNLDLDIEKIVQPWLYHHFDEWVNSKEYTTGQVNELIGTKITHRMLTETGMDVKSKEVSELYKAMVQNSIVSYEWIPQAPVYIMHSMDDETVTYLNATNAKQKWSTANIQYNFGHYGGHIKTCLRFLLTVKTLLEQERADEKKEYLN